MRLIPVNHLKEGSKIAVNIIDNDGRFLLKKGKILTNTGINILKNMGISHVYINDEYCFNTEIRTYSKEVEAIFGHILELQEIAKKTVEGQSSTEELNAARRISAQIVDQMMDLPEDFKIVYEPSKLMVNPIIEESIYVAIMSTALGVKMGLSRRELIQLCLSALLKDIALLSPSVDFDNNANYKKHPLIGYQYLRDVYELEEAILNGVLQHHELFDGSGYPNNLSGEQISRYARIISLVSHFYEMKLSHSKLFSSEILFEAKLKRLLRKFDAEMITYFIRNAEVFTRDTIVRLTNDDLAVVYANNHNNPFKPMLKIIRSMRFDEGEIISLEETQGLSIKGIEYYIA